MIVNLKFGVDPNVWYLYTSFMLTYSAFEVDNFQLSAVSLFNLLRM